MAKWKAKAGYTTTTLADGFFAFANPSGAQMIRYCYFLVRAEGNLLFQGPDEKSFYESHRSFFEEHGGIALQVLTHGPEASPVNAAVAESFDAPLYAHEWDRPEIEKKSGLALDHAFSERHALPGRGVEAIPLPGHTLGFTAYRVEAGGTRFLLLADLLVRNKKRWRAKVNKLLRDHGIASLGTVRGLDVEVMLPNMLSFHDFPVLFGRDERARIVDEALEGI
jgi:glyoxylase-like metal-dependent hydrolase (beta-lactamase superfamily II)